MYEHTIRTHNAGLQNTNSSGNVNTNSTGGDSTRMKNFGVNMYLIAGIVNLTDLNTSITHSRSIRM
ncbi:MAG: hypothetical protein FWE18_03100 [Alphaproteobacteria bacterium]|nr:hypothetical protein [Alphaproteobacteria bacterium]